MGVSKATMVSATSCDGVVNIWARLAVSFSLLFIFIVTLFPYDFSFKEAPDKWEYHSLLLGQGEWDLFDVLKNILLFLPLGFSLTWLEKKRRVGGGATLAVTLLLSFGLSCIVEILQVFLHTRFPSLIDVLSNSAGGLVGFLCFHLRRDVVLNYASVFVRKRSLKRLLLSLLLLYATLAFLSLIFLQWATSLGNWNKTFPLLLGNERTGDRPWQGYISELYIADRAISKAEVAYAFSEKDPIAAIGESLLASYQLKGTGSYHDKMGRLPDLLWKGKSQDVQQNEGIYLGPNNWLETVTSAAYLTQRLIETSQFTLSVTVATNDTTQGGPARIVSLSGDPDHRNFTLGQQGTNLAFRLRTPLTGKNGTSPELTVPDVFSSKSPHNLVITYDGSILTVYVDAVHNSHALELTPWASIPFKNLFSLKVVDWVIFKSLYYVPIFIPIGIFLIVAKKKYEEMTTYPDVNNLCWHFTTFFVKRSIKNLQSLFN